MGQLSQFLESGKAASDSVIASDFVYDGGTLSGQFRWIAQDDREWDVRHQDRRQGVICFLLSQFETLPAEGRIFQGMGKRFRAVMINDYPHLGVVKITVVAA